MSKTMGWFMDLEQLHLDGKCKLKCQFCYKEENPHLYQEPEGYDEQPITL